METLIPPAAAIGAMLAERYRVQRVLDSTLVTRRYLAEDVQASGGALAVQELFAPALLLQEDWRRASSWFDGVVEKLRALRHQALAPTLAGWADPAPGGPFYLVMGYIPGPTLADELAEAGGSVPWRQALDWALALCDLLSALHDLQPPFLLGHLRPQHIALDSRTGAPVVIDFGLAAALAGRPWDNGGYTPLEQFISRPTPRSDLYALGALLHSLLSGHDPDTALAHRLRDGQDLQRALRTLLPALDARALGLPTALPGLVVRATSFVADDRFPDAAAMAAALQALLGPAVASAPSSTTDPEEDVPAWQQLGLSRDAWFALSPQARNAQLLKLMGQRTAPPRADPLPPPAAVQVAPAPKSAPPHSSDAEAPGTPVLLVDVHVDGPYHAIARAVAAAPPGARVEIAPGYYHEALTLPRAVEVRAQGSAGEVIIEAAGQPCLTIAGRDVVVHGLTLRQVGGRGATVDCTAGNALLEDCTLVGGTPAALVREQGSTLTMRRCALQEGSGEGVRVAAGASATLEDCTIAGRGMAGILLLDEAGIEAHRCAIRDGEGPGIVCEAGAHGLIETCEIVGNAGAGLALAACEGLTVRACRIGYNGGPAIAVGDAGAGTVEDCDLTGNIGGPWQWPDDDGLDAKVRLSRRRNRE